MVNGSSLPRSPALRRRKGIRPLLAEGAIRPANTGAERRPGRCDLIRAVTEGRRLNHTPTRRIQAAALIENRQRIDQDFTVADLPQPLEWKDSRTVGDPL